jgi:pimeloyl-ACP methyl ester carboxylesterase
LIGELTTTITEDRVRLHGFRIEPEPVNPPLADAVVISHGLAGNFYSSPLLLEMAARFSNLGMEVVIGNSRGHDFLNWTLRSGRTQTLGAAVEDVDECRHDVRGWVQHLVRTGRRRILLAGHSLGAIKSLYAQAWAPAADVVGVIAVSPTRLNADQFLASESAEIFRKTLGEAQTLVDAGDADRLMQVEFPFPAWMSAIAYLRKYGHDNRFDWFGYIDRIQIPVAVWFGARELTENAAFAGLESSLEKMTQSQPNLEIGIIPDADHFYIARMDALCEQIEVWINGQAKKRITDV